jgi:hypothetical protein
MLEADREAFFDNHRNAVVEIGQGMPNFHGIDFRSFGASAWTDNLDNVPTAMPEGVAFGRFYRQAYARMEQRALTAMMGLMTLSGAARNADLVYHMQEGVNATGLVGGTGGMDPFTEDGYSEALIVSVFNDDQNQEGEAAPDLLDQAEEQLEDYLDDFDGGGPSVSGSHSEIGDATRHGSEVIYPDSDGRITLDEDSEGMSDLYGDDMTWLPDGALEGLNDHG